MHFNLPLNGSLLLKELLVPLHNLPLLGHNLALYIGPYSSWGLWGCSQTFSSFSAFGVQIRGGESLFLGYQYAELQSLELVPSQ